MRKALLATGVAILGIVGPVGMAPDVQADDTLADARNISQVTRTAHYVNPAITAYLEPTGVWPPATARGVECDGSGFTSGYVDAEDVDFWCAFAEASR